MPALLESFILSNSGTILNSFIREINGLKTNDVYHTDTDSVYIEKKKHLEVKGKAKLVWENSCQSENDYRNGGVFYPLFLAPKTKYCPFINDKGFLENNKLSGVIQFHKDY